MSNKTTESIYSENGGTVPPGKLYIERNADKELLDLCRSGVFAYVLASRQVGKSSLVHRASRILLQENFLTIFVTFEDIGKDITSEAWYYSFLDIIVNEVVKQGINLQIELGSWWDINKKLSNPRRFSKFLTEVLLSQVTNKIIIFCDEVDLTLKLDFTYDFYAVIRSTYNNRPKNPELNRLSFVLVGSATPDQLMSDPLHTPFNIGKRVELLDFSISEMKPFAEALGLPKAQSNRILNWVEKWTSGHPYLTQKIFAEIARSGKKKWLEADVDEIVRRIFLKNKLEDDNLSKVHNEMIGRFPHLTNRLFNLYKEVRLGNHPIIDQKESLIYIYLKLIGIVRREREVMIIRNRIYYHAFDEKWILDNLYGSKLTNYLDWLTRKHETLELRGVRHTGQIPIIPLNNIYVQFRDNSVGASERHESKRLLFTEQSILATTLEEDWKELERYFAWQNLPLDEQRILRWRFLASSPIMPSLIERDRAIGDQQISKQSRNLAQIIQREQVVVILGDPGIGKTTIVRWITLQYAKALRDGKSNLVVLSQQVEPSARRSHLIAPPNIDASLRPDRQHYEPPQTDFGPAYLDLGPTKLPILVRVAEFATAKEEYPSLSLEDYLGSHTWLGEAPKGITDDLPPEDLNRLMISYLEQGQAILILDGLDEIRSKDHRDSIIADIESFMHKWIYKRDQTEFDEDISLSATSEEYKAKQYNSNKLIITSRIAGYHAAPITGDLAHVTIEPMSKPGIHAFCRDWVEAVQLQLARPGEKHEEIRKRINSESESLINAIDDKARPGIEELASNPLLLTILALLHHNSEAHLPEQRVRLYRIAVETFVEVWRGSGLTEIEVRQILSPIAAHIHEHYNTGLIEESELFNLIARALATRSGIEDLDLVPDSLRQETNSFLTILREQVGLLAARGEYLYGFLHLTFQEYFCARYLVDDPETAFEKIVTHIDNPRWHEPILLGLGHYGSEFSSRSLQRLLSQILDASDPFEDILPRRTLLIVRAIYELEYTPPQIIKLVVRKLLIAYSKQLEITGFSLIQEEIENAFNQLRNTNNCSLVDTELINILKADNMDSDGSIIGAVATLIEKNQWSTANFINTLLDWRYRIDKLSYPRIQVALKTLLVDTTLKNSQVDSLDYDIGKLPMLLSLESQKQLIDHLTSNPDWMRLITALYGGYRNDNLSAIIDDYYSCCAYLNLPDDARKPYHEFYRSRWNNSADISIYTKQKKLELSDLLDTPSQFSPKYIYHDSSITEIILPLLVNKDSTEVLCKHLWAIWNTSQDISQKVQSLIGIAAIGEPIAAILTEILKRPEQNEVAENLFALMVHMESELRDPIVRSVKSLVPQLKAIADYLSPTHWIDIVHEMIDLIQYSGSIPVDVTDLLDDAPSDCRPYLIAEILAYYLSGVHEDPIYAVALMLDLVGEKLAENAESLAIAFTLIGQSRNLKSRFHYCWYVERLLPRIYMAENDIPLEALDSIEGISEEFSFLRFWALKSLKPVIGQYSQVVPEILAITLGGKNDFDGVKEVWATYAPELLESIDQRAVILQKVHDISDPYFQCRAILRLFKYYPDKRPELIEELVHASGQIDNAYNRVRIFERIIAILSPDIPESMLQAALESAFTITDSDIKAWAFARLAIIYPYVYKERLFNDCLSSIQSIRDERTKCEVLRSVLPLIQDVSLKKQAESLLLEVTDSWEIAKVLNLTSQHLLSIHQVSDPHSSVFWTPFVLMAILKDIKKNTLYEEDIETLWFNLTTGSYHEALSSLIEQGKINGLTLTCFAANSIETILTQNGQHRIYPLIQFIKQPDRNVIPLLRKWFVQLADTPVGNLAALLLTEIEGIASNTFETLVTSLKNQDDMQYRITFAIHDFSNTQSKNRLKVSTLGMDALKTLAATRVKYQYDAPQISLRIGWLFEQLIHDDPQIIYILGDKLRNESANNDSNPETVILSSIQVMAQSSLPAFYDLLRSGTPQIRTALLVSICRMLYKHDDTLQQNFDEVVSIICKFEENAIDDRLILMGGLEEVIEAANIALKESNSDSQNKTVSAAQAVLHQRFSRTLFTILSDNPDSIESDLRALATSNLYVRGNDYALKSLQAANPIRKTPELLELLVQWLVCELRENIQDDKLYRIRDSLLELVSAAAHLSPASFANLSIVSDLEPLLYKAIRHHNSYVGRRAAVIILGYLRKKVTNQTIDALLHALQDVPDVRKAALETALRFRMIDDEMLAQLSSHLYHSSTMVAYTTSQLLAALGRNERISADQQQFILTCLLTAMTDPKANRTILPAYLENRLPTLPKLRELFYRAFLVVVRRIQLDLPVTEMPSDSKGTSNKSSNENDFPLKHITFLRMGSGYIHPSANYNHDVEIFRKFALYISSKYLNDSSEPEIQYEEIDD